MKHSKMSVLNNMLWRLAERLGAQGVSFVVSLILARLLAPEDYGVVSLITVFTAFLNLFVDSGFKMALIQKKNADQLDFSSVFFFNIFMGVVFYIGMYFAAPAIADFYAKPFLVPYIRVMSLTLLPGAINGVQQARVAKRMEFKRFFYATMGGTIVSAVVGIWMALKGMGVWALIAQRLTNQVIDTIILWCMVDWRPTFEFSIARLIPMLSYSVKLLASSLLNTFTAKVANLIIGKYYSTSELAYYEKADHIPSLINANLHESFSSVLMPLMSEHQDSKAELKRIMHRSITTSSYVIFPVMIGLAACTRPLIIILYTEKWAAMIPYMQLMCLSYMFWMLHVANLQVIQATGRSDTFLKLEIIKQAISLAIVFVSIRYSVMALLIAETVESFLSFFINAYPNKKLANYGCFEQLKDLMPTLCLSVSMGALVLAIGMLPLNVYILLVLQVAAGVAFYVTGSILLKINSFYYILDVLKEIYHKIFKKVKK